MNPEKRREGPVWYLVLNPLIVLKEILKDHGGNPGMVLIVDAGVWGGVHLAGGVYFDHNISAQNEIPNVKKL